MPLLYRDEEAKLLLVPSFETKGNVFHQYRDLCQENDEPSLGFSSFREMWKRQLPHVVIAKPMADLCWVCQNGNNLILKSRANQDDGVYDDLMEKHLAHIEQATEECRYYCAQVEKAGEDAQTLIQETEEFNVFSNKPNCSFKGMAHFSWDYAQQTHYPYNPVQPGPIYFKTPRKCSIFGICNDGINMQYNYLVGEINSTGKGANATISYVHHFFENFGMGETESYPAGKKTS